VKDNLKLLEQKNLQANETSNQPPGRKHKILQVKTNSESVARRQKLSKYRNFHYMECVVTSKEPWIAYKTSQ